VGYKRIAVSEETLQRIKKIADGHGITMIALLDEFASNYVCADNGINAIEIPGLTDEENKMIQEAKETKLRTTVSITMYTMALLSILSARTGLSKALFLKRWSEKILAGWISSAEQIPMAIKR